MAAAYDETTDLVASGMMGGMRRRLLALGLLTWLTVVAVGSGIGWLVIQQVGRDVSTAPSPSVTGPRPTAPEPTALPSPIPPHSAMTRSPSTATMPTTRSPSSAPGTASVTRTWAGAAGRLTVSCTGSRASLVATSPLDGWSVEVDQRGPDRVEVTFKRAGGEDAGEVGVRARCSGGPPRYQVEQGG